MTSAATTSHIRDDTYRPKFQEGKLHGPDLALRDNIVQTSARLTLDSGQIVYEHRIGDYAKVRSPVVTDIVFTPDDAAELVAVLGCFGRLSDLVIAFYPWLESVWRDLSRTEWTTIHESRFQRKHWLRSSSHLWVIGHANTERKFAEILYWAWALPGRDSLLLIPTTDHDAAALIATFEDDTEDTTRNELRLLPHYSTVASRGFQGRYLQIFSTNVDAVVLRDCVGHSIS